MFERLKTIIWGPRDPEGKHLAEAARMLEMDEPMAGAGGLISGTHHKSETERVLERASEDHGGSK